MKLRHEGLLGAAEMPRAMGDDWGREAGSGGAVYRNSLWMESYIKKEREGNGGSLESRRCVRGGVSYGEGRSGGAGGTLAAIS